MNEQYLKSSFQTRSSVNTTSSSITTASTNPSTNTITSTTATTATSSSFFGTMQDDAALPPLDLSQGFKGVAGIVLYLFNVPGSSDVCLSLAKPSRDLVTELDLFLALYYVRVGADGAKVITRNNKPIARVVERRVELFSAGYLKFGKPKVEMGEDGLSWATEVERATASLGPWFESPWKRHCYFSAVRRDTVKCEHRNGNDQISGSNIISELRLNIALAKSMLKLTETAEKRTIFPSIQRRKQSLAIADPGSARTQQEERYYKSHPLDLPSTSPSALSSSELPLTQSETPPLPPRHTQGTATLLPSTCFRQSARSTAGRPMTITRKPVGQGKEPMSSNPRRRLGESSQIVEHVLSEHGTGDASSLQSHDIREARARGIFGRRATKLAKLIVYNEGQQMLDLVVVTNLMVFWQAYKPEQATDLTRTLY